MIISIVILVLNLFCMLGDPTIYRASTLNAIVVGMSLTNIMWINKE